MRFVRCGNVVQHFELRPPAPGVRAPALLLIHALGTAQSIWDGVVDALRFRGPILRHDLRGHGLTEVGSPPYDSALLARDALALLDALGLDSVIACGLSVGGLVAQELALLAPGRVRAAILCGTAARIGTREGWQSRIAQVRAGGIGAIADAVLTRWFSPRFRDLEPAAVSGYRALLERTPVEGYLGMLHALSEADLRERAGALRAPVLVVSGELDEATPPADGRALAALIPGAKFEQLAGASHILSVEQPRELAGLIDAFIESLAIEGLGTEGLGIESRDIDGTPRQAATPGDPAGDDVFERGLRVRRAVLGPAHVERALAAASDFDRDFQTYITRAAWGEVWARPGLPRHTRHLLTLALLAALGHQAELALHVRATLATGVTRDELKEALLQVAVYAGVPAANTAIQTAGRVFAELDSEKGEA